MSTDLTIGQHSTAVGFGVAAAAAPLLWSLVEPLKAINTNCIKRTFKAR